MLLTAPLALVVLLASLSATVCAQEPKPLSGSRPNILFVFSDDHACQAIGAYGSRFGATPHLDRLAREGVVFTANYCGNALCGPSRASILTGLHSHANGFCRNGNVFDGNQPTFPKQLQRAGYQTALVGKWHLESAPTGFDHWVVLPDQGQYYNPDFLTAAGRIRREGHATDITTALAIEWLEQRDPARPFVLMCQHKAPHRNWQPAPPEFGLFRHGDLPEPATLFDDYRGRMPARSATEMEVARHLTLHYDLLLAPTTVEQAAIAGEDRAYAALRARMTAAQRAAWDAAYGAEDAAFRRENPQGRERVRWYYQRYIKNYLRCVAGVDRSVGELSAWLDAHPEVKKNTLVIYASDQGFFLGEHGYYDKRWMDEECFRMPLLMAWPSRLPAGGTIAQLTQNIDFGPTFLDLAGAPPLPKPHGVSLVPLLEGRSVPWRDAVYYHYYESQSTHAVPAMYGVRTATHKLVHYYESAWNCHELFDLQQDPDELQNRFDDPACREVRERLLERLRALRAEYADDTGVLDAEFPCTAGLARLARDGDGYRVWANTRGGYALQPIAPRAAAVLRTTVRALSARPLQQGQVVLAGGADGRTLLRAGIDFGAKQLVLSGPAAADKRSVAIPWDGEAAIGLEIAFDLAAGRLSATAAGQQVELPLPAEFGRVQAWGFGASLSEVWFDRLQVD